MEICQRSRLYPLLSQLQSVKCSWHLLQWWTLQKYTSPALFSGSGTKCALSVPAGKKSWTTLSVLIVTKLLGTCKNRAAHTSLSLLDSLWAEMLSCNADTTGEIYKANVFCFFVLLVGFAQQWLLARKSLNGTQGSREQNLRVWQWAISLHQSVESHGFWESRSLFLLQQYLFFFSAGFTANQDFSVSKPQAFLLSFLIPVELLRLSFQECLHISNSCP